MCIRDSLFIALELVLFGAVVFVVIGGAVAIVRWLNLRSRAVHPGEHGLYPMQYHGPARYINLNDQHAQSLAVMHSVKGARAAAGSVGHLLDWQPEPAPELPAPVAEPLTPGDVVDVDPRTSPHLSLIHISEPTRPY